MGVRVLPEWLALRGRRNRDVPGSIIRRPLHDGPSDGLKEKRRVGLLDDGGRKGNKLP